MRLVSSCRCRVRAFGNNDRLMISSVLLLPVPLFALPNLLPGHLGLEPRLNVLWALLAAGALGDWLYRRGSRCRPHLVELIGLIFVLSLLFPVISANDDLLLQEAIYEPPASQCLIAGADTERQLSPAPSSRTFSPALVAVQFSLLLRSFEQLTEIAPARHDAPAIRAFGNHSPPPAHRAA